VVEELRAGPDLLESLDNSNVALIEESVFQTGSRDGKPFSIPEELASTCELTQGDADAREDSGRVFTLNGASTWVTVQCAEESAMYEGIALVLAACSELLHWDQHSPGEALRASKPLGWSYSPDMASVGLDLCKSIADLELASCKGKLEETCGMLRCVRCTLTDTGINARRCKICTLDSVAEKESLPGTASASVSSSGSTTPREWSNSDLDLDQAPSHPPISRSLSDQGPAVGNRHLSDDEVDGTEVGCRWFFRDASWAHDDSDDEEEEQEELSIRRGRSFMLESVDSIPQEWSKSELPASARCRLSAPLMERPKFSDEYDPRKPEYIRPATVEEEMKAEAELLRQQIRSLKGMIHAREGREPDSAVLDFYRCIVKQMEREIWHLEGKTYIVPSKDHDDKCDFQSYPIDLSTMDDSEVAWSGQRFLCGLDFGVVPALTM